jgi:predicted aspartyl protease
MSMSSSWLRVFVAAPLLGSPLLLACSSSSLVLEQRATLTNNLVVVPVRVNGSQPLPFIVDTGASSSVIDPRPARDLKLTLRGDTTASTGGGNVNASAINGVTLQIGDLSLPNLNIVAIDLSGLAAGLGQPIAGILGYDLFQRYVVEIDYSAGFVRLHDPGRYLPDRRLTAAQGQILPITIEDNTPFINAHVLGNLTAPAAKLEFDTGKTGALTLIREYFDTYSLRRAGQREIAVSAGALLPGQVPAIVTRVQGLQLGQLTINGIVAMIVPNRAAGDVTGTTVGILGGEVLKRFTVVIDYARNQVILKLPDRALDESFEFDMSGISLAALGPDYRDYVVRALIPGSRAADLGVAIGDHLAAIDGTPASRLTLGDIRELLRKDGHAYAIELRRGDAVVRIELRTRRLL